MLFITRLTTFGLSVPMKKETIFKTIGLINLILNLKRYIGAEKLYMYQLRTISSENKTHILKKNNIGANLEIFEQKKNQINPH